MFEITTITFPFQINQRNTSGCDHFQIEEIHVIKSFSNTSEFKLAQKKQSVRVNGVQNKQVPWYIAYITPANKNNSLMFIISLFYFEKKKYTVKPYEQTSRRK